MLYFSCSVTEVADMNDNRFQQPSDVVSEDTSSSQITPYELLMRQSRKMGNFATHTLDVTKGILKRDVATMKPKSPDILLFGKRIRPAQQSVSAEGPQSQDINHVVQRSHEVLAGAKTVILPVNLFPDSVIVDRTKVTITKRSFYWTSQVITTRIEDILSVTSSMGPLFGSLVISTRVMNSTDHYEINYFWRKDAEYLKQIIQGYVIAQHNAIETKHLTRDELVQTLLELGQDSSM